MQTLTKINSIDELKKIIRAEIQKRKSEKRPILTVSAGTCGQARGSLEVVEALKKYVKERLRLQDATDFAKLNQISSFSLRTFSINTSKMKMPKKLYLTRSSTISQSKDCCILTLPLENPLSKKGISPFIKSRCDWF
jgi:hypothetical protein